MVNDTTAHNALRSATLRSMREASKLGTSGSTPRKESREPGGLTAAFRRSIRRLGRTSKRVVLAVFNRSLRLRAIDSQRARGKNAREGTRPGVKPSRMCPALRACGDWIDVAGRSRNAAERAEHPVGEECPGVAPISAAMRDPRATSVPKALGRFRRSIALATQQSLCAGWRRDSGGKARSSQETVQRLRGDSSKAASSGGWSSSPTSQETSPDPGGPLLTWFLIAR